MALYGKLTRKEMGVSVPPISPLYGPTPTPNVGIEAMTITFETDRDAALRVLPSPLELRLPATAYMNVLHIPRSSMGEFCEASLFLAAKFEGRHCRYAVTMMVTNDGALCLGREMLGSPKKLGVVSIERRPEGVLGFVERPAGHRLVTAGMTLDQFVKKDEVDSAEGGSVALRMIKQPGDGAPGELSVQLIESRATWEVVCQWQGKGDVRFKDVIGHGSWRLLPVRTVTAATFGIYNVVIPEPQLLAAM